MRKYSIPFIAAAFLVFALVLVVRSQPIRKPASPPKIPPVAPFEHTVGGVGLVEANTENIAIGTQIAGIVSKVYVVYGSFVKAGDPLFTIDDRELKAELNVRRTELRVAEAELSDARNNLVLAERVGDKRAIRVEELDRRRFAVQIAEAKVAQAQASMKFTETDLDRLTVRAPVAAQVLQVKVRVGEFAPTGALQTPLMMLGNVDPLHIRVDIDEHEAYKVHPDDSAYAMIRGDSQIRVPLTFVRFEPYVVPKKSLTGDSTERVDTRVLQVLYSFDRGEKPIYVGEQMDVYIEASEANTARQNMLATGGRQ
jgi:RND family efflux transporter MFP subunit